MDKKGEALDAVFKLRPLRQEHLGLGPAFRGQKIPAVYHRRGEIAVADPRAVAGLPGFALMTLETFNGEVPEKLQHVTSLDQALPLRSRPGGKCLVGSKRLHLDWAPGPTSCRDG